MQASMFVVVQNHVTTEVIAGFSGLSTTSDKVCCLVYLLVRFIHLTDSERLKNLYELETNKGIPQVCLKLKLI